jgi:hypothetical protein
MLKDLGINLKKKVCEASDLRKRITTILKTGIAKKPNQTCKISAFHKALLKILVPSNDTSSKSK